MEFLPTTIPDVILINPKVFADNRGFFMETYQVKRFAEAGIDVNFVQDNHSGSCQSTLRGLHYQIQQAQGKLVRVIAGKILDVVVDLRRSSPSFGKWIGTNLSSENRRLLWVPPGFAHGFYVISEWAELTYKATNFYTPQWERTLLWNDPTVGIEWPVGHRTTPLLSEKDERGTPLDQADIFD